MKSTLCLFVFLFSFVFCDPLYWINTIPPSTPGSPTSSPTSREFQSFTNVPGTTFNVLFGGLMYNETYIDLNDTWLFDSGVSAFKPLNPALAPPARGYHVSGATDDGEIIIFGGQNELVPRVFFNDVWRYSLTSNSWTQDTYNVPSPLLARSYASGLVVGDSLYIFGGFVQALQAVSNDLWSYKWALHSLNGNPQAPKARQGHSAVFYNDSLSGPSILFFGGYNGTGGMSDTWQFEIKTTNWLQITKDQDPSGPLPRWGHSAFWGSSGNLLIFGGTFVGGPINPYYNDLWSLSRNSTSNSWSWSELIDNGDKTAPWERGGQSSFVSAGRAFTFGGYGLYVGLFNDVWELVNF